GQRGGEGLPDPAGRVFRRIVVEASARDDFTDAERPAAHHRHGELSAGNKRLDQDLSAKAPRRYLLAPGIVVDPNDADADARALVGRLDDERSRDRVTLGELFRAGDEPLGDRERGAP